MTFAAAALIMIMRSLIHVHAGGSPEPCPTHSRRSRIYNARLKDENQFIHSFMNPAYFLGLPLLPIISTNKRWITAQCAG